MVRIELLDLEGGTDVEIVTENLHAAQAIYFAYMLEELRLFQVVDRIAELFQQGQLPLGRGAAGEALQRYWRSDTRLTERERTDLYARMFGAPGGSADVQPNREFLSLWMRFLVAVSAFVRERGASEAVRPRSALDVNARRAARDLAVNLSLHGFGGAYAAAERLGAEVLHVLDILGNPEIGQAFGARDAWQVIDRVNRDHLGGAVNVARYRTQAEAGRRILGWLVGYAEAQGGPTASDADLIDAVEQWIAAGGIPDDRVDELTQPRESPPMTSGPIDLPSIATDLLAAAGFTIGEASGVVLFEGARRTGKTLAAHVLAQALAREVLRIDLAAVVSRYVGETEKNLDALFDEAERAGAVLLIDDADALFGRGGDVKDAHDRYANLDVERLIDRIAAYKGLVIVVSDQTEGSTEDGLLDRWRRRARLVRFPRTQRG